MLCSEQSENTCLLTPYDKAIVMRRIFACLLKASFRNNTSTNDFHTNRRRICYIKISEMIKMLKVEY